LAVVNFAGRATVLPGHPDTLITAFGKARLIDNERFLFVAQFLVYFATAVTRSEAHRAQWAGEHTRVANRIHKLLEDANINLGAVASNVGRGV
jgi:hypothetical protein